MVLKRKLPSHLTQDQGENKAETPVVEANTDFEAVAPEKHEVEAVPAENNKEPVAESDVFEDIPPARAASSAQPSSPPENKMKRQVRNKRGQHALDPTSGLEAAPSTNTEDTRTVSTNPEELAPMDVSETATPRPNAEDAVGNAMADLHGQIPDPAEQETEAAYQAPAEIDAPVLTGKTPKYDFTPPEYDAPASIAKEEAVTVESRVLEAQIKEETEPSPLDEPPIVMQEDVAEENMVGVAPPQIAPTLPNTPASFAEDEHTHGTSLPWVAEADQAADRDDWEIDAPEMTAPLAPPQADLYQSLNSEPEIEGEPQENITVPGSDSLFKKDKLPPPELPQ